MKQQLYNNQLIINYLKEQKVDEFEFCNRCGIDLNEYIKLGLNVPNLSFPALIRVAKVLDVRFEEFINLNSKFISFDY